LCSFSQQQARMYKIQNSCLCSETWYGQWKGRFQLKLFIFILLVLLNEKNGVTEKWWHEKCTQNFSWKTCGKKLRVRWYDNTVFLLQLWILLSQNSYSNSLASLYQFFSTTAYELLYTLVFTEMCCHVPVKTYSFDCHLAGIPATNSFMCWSY